MRRAFLEPWKLTTMVAISLGLAITTGTAVGAAIPDDCVAKRMQDGESRPEALAACLSEGNTPASKPTPKPAQSGDGTSPAVLAVAAIVGLAVGAGAMKLLGRSTVPATAPLTPAFSPTQPPPFPPAPPPAAPDRSRALIVALIDLADRVPSQALRAEIIATLQQAGVHAVEFTAGEPFDGTRMRGVGRATPPDPSWIGRVASTERPGFRDGSQGLRLPDVIVFASD